MSEALCTVSGHVQGVGYRDYVAQAAAECRVNGFVRYDTDQTVVVCAQGMPDDVKEFIEYLHEGSVLSQVVHVAVEWQSITTVYDDFLVLVS